MAAEPQWNIPLLEKDRDVFGPFLDRCKTLGVASSMAAAVRLAVQIASTASDEDLKSGEL